MFHYIEKKFKGKTIFVTGHTGFQGSWLVLWLKELGANVIGYSLPPPTQPSMFESLKLKNDLINIEDDVRNLTKLNEVFQSHKPEFVFHLAAQSLVRCSYEEPIETFQTNILGTVNILEAIRNSSSVKTAVIMTSDKCYENREWIYAYRENDPMGGYDPYSASKGAAEIVTSSYRKSFFNHEKNKKSICTIATARAGNVIGGGDWAKDRLVPDCIRSFSKNKALVLRNPQAVRPWQHVLEVLYGILCLATRLCDDHKFADSWNFGPPDLKTEMNVLGIANKIKSDWKKGKIVIKSDNKHHEANFLRLDSGKAMLKLGWHPVYSIDEALHETISWYKKYFENSTDMKKFSISQIRKYVKKGKSKISS